MGTIIEAVATSHGRSGPLAKGARRLADEAARRCLARAAHRSGEIDLLINSGIYREDDLAEPALASMIQEDIHANPGHPPVAERHGTFSFDLTNGASGVLTALQLLDGFLRSQTISLGMVVTSDVPPHRSEHFPFGNTGAAVIVRSDGAHEGFVDFSFETFQEIEDAFVSEISWHPRAHHVPLLREGHNILEVYESAEFPRLAVDCAAHVANGLLDRQKLGRHEIDLLLTSQYPKGFPHALADRLGIDGSRVVTSQTAGTHTAGPLFALEESIEQGSMREAKNVLFVTAGSGITVGAALYRP